MSKILYYEMFLKVWLLTDGHTRIRIAFTCRTYLDAYANANVSDFKQFGTNTKYWHYGDGCILCLKHMTTCGSSSCMVPVYDQCCHVPIQYVRKNLVFLCEKHFDIKCKDWHTHEKSLVLNNWMLEMLPCITCNGNPFKGLNKYKYKNHWYIFKCHTCNDCISFIADAFTLKKWKSEVKYFGQELNDTIWNIEWICNDCLDA